MAFGTSGAHEARVLYQMAHESAIAWIANERARLETNITRAAGFTAFAVSAMGAGIGISTAATSETGFGTLAWSGIAVAALGLAACFLSTARLMWPLDVPEFDPLKLITEYESEPNEEIYRDVALAGADAGRVLTKDVNRRCRWLYGNLFGFPLVVAGVSMLWVASISL